MFVLYLTELICFIFYVRMRKTARDRLFQKHVHNSSDQILDIRNSIIVYELKDIKR